MIRLNNLFLGLNTDFTCLQKEVAKALKVKPETVESVKLLRKSVDARNKNDIKFCVSVAVKLNCNEAQIIKKNKNASLYKEEKYIYKKANEKKKHTAVVVGFGPSGMFAALTLIKAGVNVIVLERGKSVDEREQDVNEFFATGKLNINSNVQFGEGGAGTFSDGKLNTGIKGVLCKEVLETFARFGANGNILYEAKPHIGTDVLKKVVKNIREELINGGAVIKFNSLMTDFSYDGEKITSVTVNNCEVIKCDAVILAIGHSARDTFALLKEKGMAMCKKPFSVGVRIEHKREDIDKAMYGSFAGHKALGAADYKLATHLQNGRGVYSFCMCPGGYVINASSENEAVCINGMSYSERNAENSNSALLVEVKPEDLLGGDVLEGCRFQQEIEKTAYKLANKCVPITTVGNFVYNKPFKLGKVKPTVLPKTNYVDFNKIFPEFICSSLKQGIINFGKSINGFDNEEAVLLAPETRSSSPVRILRNQEKQAENLVGLFPAGEGAGYAGGIMSAAVDGITVAEAAVDYLNKKYTKTAP